MVHALYRLLSTLDDAGVHYRLDRHRPETVMVTATFVGERVEIEVFEDEHIEFSRFKGDEGVESSEAEVEALMRQIAAARDE